jgi:protoporphyrinogen oxidase
MQKVAIIGAGISGLSTAHFLADRYAVTVFEKDSLPGGLIKCRRVNGNLFHTCGGHIFNSKRQDVLRWFWSQFKREVEFSKAERNSVVFMDDGAKIPYPIENHMYMFDAATQQCIISDLVKIAQTSPKPHNFEDFLKGQFGDTLYRLYFQPYNEKVWRCSLKSVPLTWLEGKLPMPTVEEIIFNNINHVDEKSFVHSTFWYGKTNGSQFIADRLAEGLHILYNADVTSMKKVGGKWYIAGQEFDKVVFCGNIKDMVRTIEGVDINNFNDAVAKLDYHGTTAVFCEIDQNPYSWIYQPSSSHESHRIICTGNFAESNNSKLAEGRTTATVEFTDNISKDEILDNLKRMPLNPTYLDHKYNQYTYPIQDADTRTVIQHLKTHLAPEGFYFTGRFADWEYYNMDVAIGAAMELCKLL